MGDALLLTAVAAVATVLGALIGAIPTVLMSRNNAKVAAAEASNFLATAEETRNKGWAALYQQLRVEFAEEIKLRTIDRELIRELRDGQERDRTLIEQMRIERARDREEIAQLQIDKTELHMSIDMLRRQIADMQK